jgi:uncharacterized protein with PQ loop repeat
MSRNNHHAQKKHAKKKWGQKEISEKMVYVAAIVEPIITIPQAYVIFKDQTAAGVALSSWIGYQLLTLVWIWYAIVHKERLILVYQGLFLIIQAFVIVGAIMYGAPW